ncbi:DNA gyrase/topoisomerase IV, subunit A [Treponema bryantii]|uniref:DNA gyrase/topoisomerase IV, subunit A n=1 Tax=Treponema bryantii TaxID=163 RepID=A0A1I3LM13_9SPIR|nr:DNA gyrase subunit A [Treponema bryantii]SFI85752.1 DNA gyrase/topoisomerase IV, subunit A [Treponema bryantii]
MSESKEELCKYRLQLLNAIKIFLDNPHEIIDIGLQSQNSEDFKVKLQSKYGLTDEQAQCIADVQIKRITQLLKKDFQNELKELQALQTSV